MLAAQLNRYLARALERSPRARTLCTALEGRRLKVQVEGAPAALWLTVTNAGLQATHTPSGMEATADITVRGSPLGLLALATGDANDVVMRGSAQVDGDERLAQQFQELARLLRPDLEAAAAGVVGRIPAHLATRALTLLSSWGSAARESVARNAADYLAHESRDLVPRAEAESHFTGIDALRSAVTRAEARLTHLDEKMAALTLRGAS
jgi:ubiquinone biosynthesis protein UbiJ